MKYLASSVFFGIWAYLFHFYMAQDFTLRLYPREGGIGEVSETSALWMFLPLAFGAYLFVIAERERKIQAARAEAAEANPTVPSMRFGEWSAEKPEPEA